MKEVGQHVILFFSIDTWFQSFDTKHFTVLWSGRKYCLQEGRSIRRLQRFSGLITIALQNSSQRYCFNWSISFSNYSSSSSSSSWELRSGNETSGGTHFLIGVKWEWFWQFFNWKTPRLGISRPRNVWVHRKLTVLKYGSLNLSATCLVVTRAATGWPLPIGFPIVTASGTKSTNIYTCIKNDKTGLQTRIVQ